MALELRIEGPGLDVVRRLEFGQPELVLGRGSGCGVCLPDPLRRVSRRHLSVWLETGQMHFRVLSVNGVETPAGEVPPGARGVLPADQTLRLAEYSLTVRAPPEAARSTQPGALSEEDPFGEWEFEATFRPVGGPDSGQGTGTSGATDLSAFFQGLGLEPATLGPLSRGELETIGKLVRRREIHAGGVRARGAQSAAAGRWFPPLREPARLGRL